MSDLLKVDWENILEILITAPILYLVVIACVRASGNRSTSQMNNFDWIVTVAVGGIFASTVILNNASLIEGVFGIAVLLFLQFALTQLIRKSERIKKWIRLPPHLLFYNGRFLEDNMKRQRILHEEIHSAVREAGYQHVQDIYAVVLESNARLTVIPKRNSDPPGGQALTNVKGLPDELEDRLEKE